MWLRGVISRVSATTTYLLHIDHDHRLIVHTMDSFDNFQYDSASSYGGLPIVDDTSSVVSGYTTTTQNRLPADLESLSGLSLSGDTAFAGRNGVSDMPPALRAGVIEEDLLDDLKDEGAVELPPHACRQVLHSHLPH